MARRGRQSIFVLGRAAGRPTCVAVEICRALVSVPVTRGGAGAQSRAAELLGDNVREAGTGRRREKETEVACLYARVHVTGERRWAACMTLTERRDVRCASDRDCVAGR